MRVTKNAGLILVGVLLGIAGSMASSHVVAQANPAIQPGRVVEVQPGEPAGSIITGENIGFQLVAPGQRSDVAMGKLMIRVNRRWLPAAAQTGLIPAR